VAGQYCTFLLDGRLFGIPVGTVQEVLRRQDMTPVPLASAEVTGLLNLRGQIVTAIDLRARLGLPARTEDDSAVNVVVRTADGVVSLLIDAIGDVLEPADSDFERAPETVPAAVRALVTKVCKLEGRLMMVLDTNLAVTVGEPA
jgi:purine-binding chemotaxis protein CheW